MTTWGDAVATWGDAVVAWDGSGASAVVPPRGHRPVLTVSLTLEPDDEAVALVLSILRRHLLA